MQFPAKSVVPVCSSSFINLPLIFTGAQWPLQMSRETREREREGERETDRDIDRDGERERGTETRRERRKET